jgi:hypothetical protein
MIERLLLAYSVEKLCLASAPKIREEFFLVLRAINIAG